MGVPRDYIKLSEDDDCRTIVTVFAQPNQAHPPGLPEHAEHRETKHEEFNAVARKLTRAVQANTRWPVHCEVRSSEKRQGMVLAMDVVVLTNDDRYDDKIDALDGLFKNIFKDTRVQSDASEIEFDHEHRLRAYSHHGMSFELLLSPALLQLARCQTLAAYEGGPDENRRSSAKR